MEQPKQYTPEEIAQLEKSRTISDAELLEGGAEYKINEKGEKENLLITNEQESKFHKVFEDDETRKREYKELEEARLKAAPLFVKEMGKRIRERLDAGDLDTVMRVGHMSMMRGSLNEEQLGFLEDVQRAYRDSGLEKLTDGVDCKHCFVRSIAQGGDEELAQQLLVGLGGYGSIKNGELGLGMNWGTKG